MSCTWLATRSLPTQQLVLALFPTHGASKYSSKDVAIEVALSRASSTKISDEEADAFEDVAVRFFVPLRDSIDDSVVLVVVVETSQSVESTNHRWMTQCFFHHLLLVSSVGSECYSFQ